MRINNRLPLNAQCRDSGHAPPEVRYIAELNQTAITCPRCSKTAYEEGDIS
jgi:hypothetical protein